MPRLLRLPTIRLGLLFTFLTVTIIQCGPGSSIAQVSDAAEQIAAAVQAAPSEYREGARVIGFAPDGTTVDLRAGSNEMVCLSDNPAQEGWSVACYHVSLEPFMAMGRSLRAEGITDSAEIQKRRFEAADAQTLAMPEKPAALYVMTGDGFDAVTGEVANPYVRYVLYTPWATAESMGLATQPEYSGQPWVMFPGTAGAHIMISPAQSQE